MGSWDTCRLAVQNVYRMELTAESGFGCWSCISEYSQSRGRFLDACQIKMAAVLPEFDRWRDGVRHKPCYVTVSHALNRHSGFITEHPKTAEKFCER